MKPAFTEIEAQTVAAVVLPKYDRIHTSPASDWHDRGIINEFIKTLAGANGNPMIAGGCFESLFHSRPPKDYDVFFNGADMFNAFYKQLTGTPNEFNQLGGYTPSHTLQDAEASDVRFVEFTKPGSPKIQAIKTMWYQDFKQLLLSFDFTAAMMGVQRVNGELQAYWHRSAPMDIARKRLVLETMTFPASTLRRMVKYTHKGYYVCPGSMQAIASAVAHNLTGGAPLVSTVAGRYYID